MRLPGLLIGSLIASAACSSSSSSVTDGGGDALTCGTTVAVYCAAYPCPMTLAGAKQDKSLCPAALTPCIDYDMIVKPAVDTSTIYYYAQGNLAVIIHALLPGKMTCLAGPPTFTTPICTKQSQPLPACQ